MVRQSLRTFLALRRLTGLSSGGNWFRSIVLPESRYSARITGPLRRRFLRGTRWRSGYRAGDVIESGIIDDIPRYHASHLLFVDKFLRWLGDISLKKYDKNKLPTPTILLDYKYVDISEQDDYPILIRSIVAMIIILPIIAHNAQRKLRR